MTDEPAPTVPLERPFGRQLRSHGPFRGTMLSALAHLIVVAVLLWAGRSHFLDARASPGDEPGRGGGGGGGIRGLAVFPVLAAAARAPTPPQPPAQQTVERLTVPQQVLPLPVSPHTDSVPATIVPPTGAGDPTGGQGTTPGAGPGSGGGTGSGLGPGVGSDTGAGGGGGAIVPPFLEGMIIPPTNAPREVRGTSLAVTFRVSERGEVVDVTVDPPIRDRGYRNEFLDRMRACRFRPAHTRDGRPVAAETVIHVRVGG